MKGIEMSKKETKQQQLTYICPISTEIHAAKPANCPKCGMMLVKEKAKVIITTPAAKKKCKAFAF
ncbi:heavy metal-binding domain-containing protein [Ferruginibacter profundus]